MRNTKEKQIYLGTKGNCFDKNFNIITKENNFKKLKDRLPEFPRISNSENYLEFEKAALEWKKQVDLLTQSMILPNTIGKSFYRPYYRNQYEENTTTSIDTESETSSLDTTSRGSGSFSRTSETQSRGSGIFGSIKLGNEFNNDTLNTPTKSQLKEGNDKKYIEKGARLPEFMLDTESIITMSEPWNNVLIPSEPQVEHYETLEEYEQAYQKWHKIVIGTVENVPPHANDFVKIHNILTKKAKEEQEEQITKMKLEQRQQTQMKNENENENENKGDQYQISKNISIFSSQYQNWTLKLNQKCLHDRPSYNKEALEKFKYEIHHKSLLQLSKFNYRPFHNSSLDPDKGGHNQVNYLEYHTTDYIPYQETKRVFNPDFLERYDNAKTETLNAIKKSLADQFTFVSLKKKVYELDFKTKRVIGKLHGTSRNFNQPLKKSKSKLNFAIENHYLRRNDLDEKDYQRSSDCTKRIDNQNILFILPKYDAPTPIDLKLLQQEDKNYINNRINALKTIDREYKKDSLNSFYYPKNFTRSKISQQKKKIEEILRDNKKFSSKDKLYHIILSDICYDTFVDLMFEEIFLKTNKVISEVIYSLIDYQILHYLVKIYDNSSSHLVHAKLSFLLAGILEKTSGTQIIQQCLQQQDYKCLYYLAYAMNFKENTQNSIAPIPLQATEYSKMLFGKDHFQVEKNIFIYHFLQNIKNPMLLPSNKLLYFTVSEQIKHYAHTVSQSFSQITENNPKFLSTDIWIGLSSRSIEISSYYLFLILNLIQSEKKEIQDFLLTEEVNLFVKIRNLIKSKMSHIRFGGKIIILKILKNKNMTNYFLKKYSDNFDYFLFDLIPPSLHSNIQFKENSFLEKQLKKENNRNHKYNHNNNHNNHNHNNNNNNNNNGIKLEEKTKIPEISKFCFDIVKKKLTILNSVSLKQNNNINNKKNLRNSKNDKDKINDDDLAYLESNNIHKLINVLFDFVVNKKIKHPILDLISKLISIIGKVLPLWTWVESKIEGKKIKIRSFQQTEKRKTIIITGELLQKILTTIQTTTNEYDRTKRNLISFLINLIKCPQIYELITTQEKFFNQFYSITRSSNSVRLSKKTWKFLYKLILYNPKSINDLIEQKKFNSFLGLISSVSTIPAVTFGLDFLNKCFSLLETDFEEKKLEIREIDYRDNQYPLEKIQKVHHTFLNFFSQFSMFVKLNMVFMKYGKEDNQRKINWFVMIKLAQVYFMILSNNMCSKILKDNYKKEQYQEGFKFFESIIQDQKKCLDLVENSKTKKNKSRSFYKINKEEKNNKKKFIAKTLKKGSFRKWLKKNKN
ncbi:sca1 complex scaffold protein scaa [Anaeramoeba flamelloides]|uniref:Sca1 complex scaffold protein scaa n=1 Tax=Anaeramoeba flamelloides TaxID=1746091 RepID=A0AAV7ZV22_9EUKA|nr:sca1 complex scaffold protein scaa [Anaeramoeba flamelloides]